VTYSATKLPGGPFAFSPLLSTPPPGTCAVYPGVGDFMSTGKIAEAPAPTLDAGSQLVIAGPGGQKNVTLVSGGAPLGSFLPLYSLPNQLFLNPGKYTVSGHGGTDIGQLNATVTVPSPFNWTNRDQITTVDRSEPLTLTWSGAPSGESVVIFGADSDLRTNSSAVFVCLAAAGSNSFSIPPEVLQAIPVTQPNVLASKSVLYLMSTNPVSFTAKGLDTGAAAAVYGTGKTVVFQ